MYIGIIGWFNEESFKNAAEKGISALEFDINDNFRVPEFTAAVPQINEWIKKYGVSVAAVGQWGTERLLPDRTLNEAQIEIEKELMRSAAAVGCHVYITGCNRGQTLWDDDADFAAAAKYMRRLVEYGNGIGVKVCLYNCDWNNFLDNSGAWGRIIPEVPGLGIKFDPSHAVVHGRDWREEMRKWSKHFYHVHIKGTLYLGDNWWDFPPAGLDDFDWHSFFGYLYAGGYDGCVSLEPHSSIWQGELGEKGIKYTVDYIKPMLL